MNLLTTNQIIQKLENNPNGVRYSELVRQISEAFPEIAVNTIRGAVWDLDRRFPNKIYKPARCIFRLTKFKDLEIKEEDFYQPFADWLINETEELTKATPLGGNRFRGRWGTPDVVGIRESKK